MISWVGSIDIFPDGAVDILAAVDGLATMSFGEGRIRKARAASLRRV